MAKKRKGKKRSRKKVKRKTNKGLPSSESINYYDVEEENSVIDDYLNDIMGHDVTENLNSESLFAIYNVFFKINSMLEEVANDIDHAQEEPKYSFSRSQIKELEKL